MFCMMKGHMESNEAIFIVLIMLGLVAGALVLMNGSTPAQGNDNASALQYATGDSGSGLPNTSVAAPANITATSPAPLQSTDKSLGGLLDDGLARADSWFHSHQFPGNYNMERFTWSLSASNESPDAAAVQKNDLRASLIRFNGRYIDSLRGFAFAVYVPVDVVAPMQIRGTMIFLSNSTLFDLQNSSSFSIDYDPHPRGTQTMDGCTILSGEEFLTAAGNSIKVYDFHCEVIYGAWP